MELITFECANCRQVLKVGADKAGKKAKCPRCATPLQVPTADGGSSAPPAARPAAPPTVKRVVEEEVIEAQFVEDRPSARGSPGRPPDNGDDYEVVRPKRPSQPAKDRYEEDEIEEDRPRPRRRPRDEEDEEEDDRPRRRGRSREEDYDDDKDRPRRRRSRDEEEDEDDRPRRKRYAEEDYEKDEDDRPRRRRGRDEDDDDRDDRDDRRSRRRRARSRPRGMGMLPIASLLGFIAACVIAGACLPQSVNYIMLTIALFKEGPNFGKAFEVFFKITEFMVLGYAITAMVSYSFNMTVPNRSGSIGFSIATLVVGAAYLVMYFIFIFLPIFGATGGWGSFVGGPGPGGGSFFWPWFLLLSIQMLFTAPFILSAFFVRAVALGVRNRGFAGQCLAVVLLAAGYAVIRLITYIMFYVGVKNPSKGMAWVCMILVWIGFGIFVAMIINYMKLLFQAQGLEED